MARSFNGSTDKLVGSNLGNPANITVSVWAYPTALTSAYGSTAWAAWDASHTRYSIYIKSNGKLAMYYNGSAQFYDGTGSNTLSTNTWYHLLFLGTSGSNCTGYVNGSLDGTGSAAYSNTSSTGAFDFGDDSAGNIFAGRLADGAVWSVALTTAEISALAKGARPGTIRPASLIGWWPLDGLQSPEPDLSGNANNGTLTGTALAAGPPIMMFTPRIPPFIPGAAGGGSSVVFRKTLSQIGGRVGSRQIDGYMNG